MASSAWVSRVKRRERQGRLRLVLGLAGFVDFHLATGADDDGLVRFIQGQHMQDVAVRIELGMHRSRQVELPAQYLLAFTVVRGQTQVLDARAHLIIVTVGGVMADRESHATSR
jgi:hypothetical protein